MVILSYIVESDFGFAPNPYWGTMTLTTCKSPIRCDAKRLCDLHDEFWIIGTGSKNVHISDGSYKDYSKKLVFAMRISKILTLKDYDSYCIQTNSDLHDKIPKKSTDFKRMVGDCIYRYPIRGNDPIQRPGLHCPDHIEDDLKGKYSLHSNDFYYFGVNAVTIPNEFNDLIIAGQGYKKNEKEVLILSFLSWLRNVGFAKNR
jgi:hypothetical protein